MPRKRSAIEVLRDVLRAAQEFAESLGDLPSPPAQGKRIPITSMTCRHLSSVLVIDEYGNYERCLDCDEIIRASMHGHLSS